MYKLFSISLTIITAALVIIPAFVDGQIRTSTNYQIERDSINIGGGFSTSTSFSLEDTVGEVATGRSTSTNYMIDAGYQQPEDTYITISAPADVNMDPINGLIGGTSTSSVAWTVTTNSNAGYSMSIKASTSPALASSNDYFADYNPGGDPDFTWSIASTEAAFGYSASGADIIDKFKDNGVACNTGSGDTAEACWDGFTTSDETIVQSTSANAPSGTETTVELRAESGADKILTSGDYSAVITVTAVAL